MSKCECKECVHEKVCRTREFPSIEEILKDGCPHYKDKSLFVELPCKVGRVVYVLRSQTSNGKNLYLREERISHYRVFTDHIFMCFESGRLSVPNYLWNKTVFLNRDEAEKKLKERVCEYEHKKVH